MTINDTWRYMGYAEGISWVHHHWFAIILTCWLLQHPLSFSCSVDINGTYKKMTGVRLEKSVAPGRGWGWLWTIALLSVQSSPGQEEKKTWCGKCGSGATSHWLDMNWQPQRREDKMVLAFGSAIFTNKKDPENTWKYKFRLFFGMMHGLCTCNKKLNKAAIQI